MHPKTKPNANEIRIKRHTKSNCDAPTSSSSKIKIYTYTTRTRDDRTNDALTPSNWLKTYEKKIVARCKRPHPHIRYFQIVRNIITNHHMTITVTHTHALQFHPEILRCISETSKPDKQQDIWRKIFVLQFRFIEYVRVFALTGCAFFNCILCTRTHQQHFFFSISL